MDLNSLVLRTKFFCKDKSNTIGIGTFFNNPTVEIFATNSVYLEELVVDVM